MTHGFWVSKSANFVSIKVVLPQFEALWVKKNIDYVFDCLFTSSFLGTCPIIESDLLGYCLFCFIGLIVTYEAT